MSDSRAFVELPAAETIRLNWPTHNHHLFDQPGLFFARTRMNPDYGRPGWTRDCGKRLHRGVDIAPLHPRPTGKFARVLFSDCSSGREFVSDEPAYNVHEPVFAVMAGEIIEAESNPFASTFGCHVNIRHLWPESGKTFYSLYAHLQTLDVGAGDIVTGGQQIGCMGQTSSSADARNWMAIAPHLHLEFRDEQDRHYDPESMLRAFLA